jgi:hypothetical protein
MTGEILDDGTGLEGPGAADTANNVLIAPNIN